MKKVKIKTAPTLKTKIVSSYRVDYKDLEEFIQAVYGKEFSFIERQECCNDSSHEFSATGKLLDYEAEELKTWLEEDGDSPSTYTIFNDLAKKKFIKKGHYIVNVCW